MPKFAFIKRFDTGSLADGATYEKTWTSTESLILHKIFIQAVDGSALNKSLFWLKVDKDIYTLDDAPALLFYPDYQKGLTLDIELKQGSEVNFIFKNLEGAAKQVYITLELQRP
jgi:hypothetical protein